MLLWLLANNQGQLMILNFFCWGPLRHFRSVRWYLGECMRSGITARQVYWTGVTVILCHPDAVLSTEHKPLRTWRAPLSPTSAPSVYLFYHLFLLITLTASCTLSLCVPTGSCGSLFIFSPAHVHPSTHPICISTPAHTFVFSVESLLLISTIIIQLWLNVVKSLRGGKYAVTYLIFQ